MDIICNQESGSQRAIQYAIDALPPEGGRVIVPAGNWESGPICLRSNVELHLENGAEVWFLSDPAAYLPPVFTRQDGIECMSYAPLIRAEHASHVIVSGNGVFHGNGQEWFSSCRTACRLLRQESAFHTPVEDRLYLHDSAAIRPCFLQFTHSDHIILRDFRVEDSPQLAIHLLYSDNARLSRITVQSEGTDGICVDSSSRIQMDNCHFLDTRNSILFGAGWREDGRRVNIPCQDVELRHCTFDRAGSAIVVGPCLSGGIEGLTVRRCTIQDTDYGILCHFPANVGGSVRDCRFEYLNFRRCGHSAICINGQPLSCAAGIAQNSRQTREKPPLLERLSFHTVFGDMAHLECSIAGLSARQRAAIQMDDVEATTLRPDFRLASG